MKAVQVLASSPLVLGLAVASLCGCSTWGNGRGINQQLELPPVSPADAPRPDFETDTVHWETNWETAREKAASGGKIVLVNFTGSDWCHWCQRLKSEVLSQPEFAAWANQKAVLLEVDFPRNRELPQEQANHNQRLQQQFHRSIEGYPTVLLLDPTGEVRGKLGYVTGGAEVWIRQANRQLGQSMTGRP
jgi:protein disulfide-isomerase